MFTNRKDAGIQLAQALKDYAGRDDVVVLALPRGGVPVGFEVARALSAPLDVFLVRKLGAPFERELAIGAIAEGGVCYLNNELIRQLEISQTAVEEITEQEQRELDSRAKLYRQQHEKVDVSDKVVILVDDGVATGATMMAAIQALRQMPIQRLVVAVPVSAHQSLHEIETLADQVVSLLTPFDLGAIGYYYDDFGQTSDEEVLTILSLSQ